MARALGHRFKSPDLLAEALTHASAGAPRDNERLEFLGDRVLGLVITELLMAAFPDTQEGGLAPRLNALVRKETLAAVAQDIGLEKELTLGSGSGAVAPAILADACEAVIAALYLDGGYKAARRFIEKYWAERVAALADVPRDAKTALQEWAQARGLPPPVYRLVGREGPDHAPNFRVAAELPGLAPTTAEGASKRAAEQAAAAEMLERLGLRRSSHG